jgi:hypothetical protein
MAADPSRIPDERTEVPDQIPDSYAPPEIVVVGNVADITRAAKEVGAADGETFLGLDIGSV